MKNLYGLIGFPLTHSFSKKYFTEKFLDQGLTNHEYELFPIEKIEDVRNIIHDHDTLRGLNVTIPYKESVIPFLDRLNESAEQVGAVNVIKIDDGILTGYNSDFYGFQQSILNWLPNDYQNINALVLGTGGASKAITAVLKSLSMEYQLVSRNGSNKALTYASLQSSSLVVDSKLIINTTPLGMVPLLHGFPDIPYSQITPDHFVYDLIYNPEKTEFLKKCSDCGTKTKNGLEMLELQAEKSWEIWSS